MSLIVQFAHSPPRSFETQDEEIKVGEVTLIKRTYIHQNGKQEVEFIITVYQKCYIDGGSELESIPITYGIDVNTGCILTDSRYIFKVIQITELNQLRQIIGLDIITEEQQTTNIEQLNVETRLTRVDLQTIPHAVEPCMSI